TLQAETLAVSGARLPAPEEVEERARLEERVTLLRHLLETVDLLYDAFGRIRVGEGWPKELARMQKWLQRDERGRRWGIGWPARLAPHKPEAQARDFSFPRLRFGLAWGAASGSGRGVVDLDDLVAEQAHGHLDLGDLALLLAEQALADGAGR